MKRVLGLDIGTNSVGWALVERDWNKHEGRIIGAGSRIIPMGQDVLGKFDSGVSISQTAERTNYRGVRRLYERSKLRRQRLHRVLNILGYLPEHYANAIDFDKRKGQFLPETEVKLNYKENEGGNGYEFIFKESFHEMAAEFKDAGVTENIPYDWTIYYLRKKALNHKISKEELSWILLNFNQKRGYYQLRGEDIDDNKQKKYVELKVDKIVDSGEKVKGKTLYKVIFDNGWQYDKPIVKTEDWIGRTKEFIVTEKTLKDDTIKRSFKAVDSETDWPAIKAKTEQDIDQSGKTVGEYIYSQLLKNPTQKVRGKLVKTIERKFFKNELRKILESQSKFHDELKDKGLYEKCITELYSKNISHRNKISNEDLSYLIIEDIVFYQRPLKSKKSSIGGCQFEYRTYKVKDEKTGKEKVIKKPINAIPKSHPLYQEFRLWQFVSNIRIFRKEVEIGGKNGVDPDVTNELFNSQEDYILLFEFLNGKKEIDQKGFIKFLIDNNKIEKANKDDYIWNYADDKNFPCNSTRTFLLKSLKGIDGLNPEKFLTSEMEVELWHIIYSVKDKEEYRKALKTFAKKHGIDVESFIENFNKIPPFPNEYGRYSQKAIRKILSLLRVGKYWNEELIDTVQDKKGNKILRDRIEKIITGEYDEKISDRVREKSIKLKSISDFQGLPLWLATYIIYGRHSELSDITRWESIEDIDMYLKEFKQHSLRNPIVEQVILETLRVVRDIWAYYGKGASKYFDEIHLELGREMKNPAAKREKMSKQINENENTNARIRKLLTELMNDSSMQGDIRSYSPSQQELLKIYEEGVSQNPNVRYDKVSEDEILKIRRSKSPTKSEIVRYKLWLEQGYISPYTGKVIPLSKLFTRAYDIEHIIPQSRYFDNSLSNKIICERAVNEEKGNMTAIEFINKMDGEQVGEYHILKPDEYIAHCNQYFKTSRSKLANLMSEEIPEGFINRQMNDSRYISKYVKSLLGNIVRDHDEKEATPKRLIPFSGAITSKLKHDWGLNDKWNEIIAPRFERLNKLTNSNDFGYFDPKINAFRLQVPDDLRRGFSAKRIDHRHHALDAIVLAAATAKHINYLNSLNNKENYSYRESLVIKKENGDYTKHFKLPWRSFPIDTKDCLQKIIVSFKQNLRVINKTNNKTWQWVEENGRWKKKLIRQKGQNWAVRKSLHKETVSGKININTPKGKIATAVRTELSSISNDKHISKVTDPSIQKILRNHLSKYKNEKGNPDYERAFSISGIEDMNQNIVTLNGGKNHQPIKKVRMFEIGSKFPVGHSGNNNTKYVEAAKGTNLYFAIYKDVKKHERVFVTVPFNEVVEHQKIEALTDVKNKYPIQVDSSNGDFLFTLSPDDLVYIPSYQDLENINSLNDIHLDAFKVKRIYKMISCTGGECHFIPNATAMEIKKNENGTNSKNERLQEFGDEYDILDEKEKGVMIKKVCWKLKVDRLGNILNIIKGNYNNDNSNLVEEPSATYQRLTISKTFDEAEEKEIRDIKKYVIENSPEQRMIKTMELIRQSFSMFGKIIQPNNNRLTIIKGSS